MTGRDIRDVAYHEAGHAVADWAADLPFSYATIIPAGRYLGMVSRTDDPPDAPCRQREEELWELLARCFCDYDLTALDEADAAINAYFEILTPDEVAKARHEMSDPVVAENLIVTLHAGPVAELFVTGEYNVRHARFDRTMAFGRIVALLDARGQLSAEGVDSMWAMTHGKAIELVQRNWAPLTALARELLRCGTVSGTDAVNVLRDALG